MYEITHADHTEEKRVIIYALTSTGYFIWKLICDNAWLVVLFIDCVRSLHIWSLNTLLALKSVNFRKVAIILLLFSFTKRWKSDVSKPVGFGRPD